jgi:hypothetical protein
MRFDNIPRGRLAMRDFDSIWGNQLKRWNHISPQKQNVPILFQFQKTGQLLFEQLYIFDAYIVLANENRRQSLFLGEF